MGIFDSLKRKKISGGRKISAPKSDTLAVEKKESTPSSVSAATDEKRPRRAGSVAHEVLLYPYVSEKTTIQESLQQYTFIVARAATKPAVRTAVKDVYGVMPMRVRMVNVEGKDVRVGRIFGKRSDIKKAIVTMPKGQILQIHEAV